MKVRHILVPTDLSDESVRPFEWVSELASTLGAKVTLLNVVPELQAVPYGAPLAPPVAAPDTPQRMETARRSLAEQRRELGLDANVELDVISHDNVAKGILQYAEEHDVDLIAISTHGRTGFRRLAIGSVVEAVLRRSSIPVLSFHRPES